MSLVLISNILGSCLCFPGNRTRLLTHDSESQQGTSTVTLCSSNLVRIYSRNVPIFLIFQVSRSTTVCFLGFWNHCSVTRTGWQTFQSSLPLKLFKSQWLLHKSLLLSTFSRKTIQPKRKAKHNTSNPSSQQHPALKPTASKPRNRPSSSLKKKSSSSD